MTFKTYGDAIKSLDSALRLSHKDIYKQHYGTPDYFRESTLATHRTYQAWAIEHGMDPTESRDAIGQHVKAYAMPVCVQMCVLFTTLPDAFNVRGKWTAE